MSERLPYKGGTCYVRETKTQEKRAEKPEIWEKAAVGGGIGSCGCRAWCSGVSGSEKILPAAGDKPAEPRTPGELLVYYMAGIETESYEAMYGMLDEQSRGAISPEAFVERNRNIYEGIEASGVQVEITETQESGSQAVTVFYETRMDTAAGEISFSNKAVFLKNKLEKRKKDIRMCLFGMTV